MKLNKTIFPLTLALVAMLGATGCYKSHPKVTQLPGTQVPITGEQQPPTLPPGDTFGTGGGPGSTGLSTGPGTLATAEGWDPSQCDQDRAALADQTVHFAFDSAAVLSKEQNKIVIVSEKLKSDASALLLIEGHCDERGTEEYNRSLGERRALALREALASAGIDPQRIRTISYGKDKPADPGHDESAWSKNRRGEFVLCHKKAGA
jgi:peptidoglycan-associated lipoprotein